MSSVDWPHVDAHCVSLPTIVSSTDLFDGELFGEELIDIYNSTMEQEGDDSVNDGIQQLLGSSHDPEKKRNLDDDNQDNDPAMDDGFGAFRPSTSFNDLTTLLPPSAENETTVSEAADNPRENEIKADSASQVSKKRPASVAPHNCPAGKRKTTVARSGRRPSASKRQEDEAETSNTPAFETSKGDSTANKGKDTPDPLSFEAEAIPKPVIVVTKAAQPIVGGPLPSLVVSATVVTVTPTEADFKSLAQSAVADLIQTAGKPDETSSFDGSEKVDTSTAHIKALTGNNWVAACGGSTSSSASVGSVTDSKGNNNNNNRARRQNMTADERARQNRDRNREHARNTRLRKKAYVEELKRTLTELVAQRDAADLEKRQTAQRELEQREVRFRVIEEFLKLRARNESNFARWAAILEDGFTCTLPSANFQKLHKQTQGSDSLGGERVLNGVSESMEDAQSFSAFLQTIGNNFEGTSVTFQYSCDRKNFFMDGCNAVLEWTATSVGAVAKGASEELKLQGISRCKFSPASNRLISAKMLFDTGAIMAQIPKHGPINGVGVTSSSSVYDPVATPAVTISEISAAEAAAHEADAILDSLQMPRLSAPVPSAVSLVPLSSSSSSSEGSSEKGELYTDESDVEPSEKAESDTSNSVKKEAQGMTTRRTLRRTD